MKWVKETNEKVLESNEWNDSFNVVLILHIEI
jgi:hypothetical protein